MLDRVFAAGKPVKVTRVQSGRRALAEIIGSQQGDQDQNQLMFVV
jgi:hypothetical protein